MHLHCVLLCFQAVFGLKINFSKSEMARIGGDCSAEVFAEVLGSRDVKFPFKCIGVLLGAKYKDQISWQPVIELFEKRLTGWKRNFLF